MKEKKHNYFYKITNLINGKYYYGIRSVDVSPDKDFYFGSGTAFKKALKKYDRKNFTKEILADYQTRKEASDHEARVVTLELVKLEECYNCRTGGDNEFVCNQSEETKLKISIGCVGKNKGNNHYLFEKSHSNETKVKISQSLIGNTRTLGFKHSEETRKKLSELRKGTKHSFYGKSHSKESIHKISQAKSYRCEINGVEFVSYLEASKSLGLSPSTVRRRVNSVDTVWETWRRVI